MGRSKGVTRFKLVEPGGDPFLCFGGRGVRSLLEVPGIKLAGFCAGEGPRMGLLPLLFAYSSRQMGEGSWEGHRSPSVLVAVPEPFDAVSVGFLRREFCPPIRHLVALNTRVGWAPPYLDRALDLLQGLTRLEGVLLAWT